MEFDITKSIKSLERFYENNQLSPEEKKEKGRILLVLEKTRDKKLVLQAVHENDIGALERIKAFFGFGNYKLQKIVNALESFETFLNTKGEEITSKQRDVLNESINQVKNKIIRHNETPLSRKITDIFGKMRLDQHNVARYETTCIPQPI